jgi:hypothetical protein
MTYVLLTLALAAPAHRHCARTFTPSMGIRAAHTIYRDGHTPTLRNLRLLGYIERCQRDPRNQSAVREHDRHMDALRKAHLVPPLSYATASWYDDGGTTASGWHAFYGVANKSVAFGTHVLFVYGGRRVEAVVDDRGPYVGGRTWDLNQNTASALGFGGVGTVGYAFK